MKNVFKNMRGAGLAGLLVMAVVFAVSVVLAGGLYFAKLSRGMELNEVNDEISAHRTIAPIVASLKARRVETEKLLTPAAVYDMPKDVRGLLKTLRVVAQDAGLHNTQFLPDAISVVGKSDIRLKGEAQGSTDCFRRFLVGLSSQDWISSIGRVKASAGDDADSNQYEVTIRARFGLLEEQGGK